MLPERGDTGYKVGTVSLRVDSSPMRACKIDSNQPAIVKRLREMGATVQILSAVGKGCPDLLVGFRNRNLLMEVKDGDAPKSQQKLTSDQVKWHGEWRGQVIVVNTVGQAQLALLAAWMP